VEAADNRISSRGSDSGVFLGTTGLNGQKPRMLLAEYVRGMIDPYPTADELIADYLRQYANDGETVFVNLKPGEFWLYWNAWVNWH